MSLLVTWEKYFISIVSNMYVVPYRRGTFHTYRWYVCVRALRTDLSVMIKEYIWFLQFSLQPCAKKSISIIQLQTILVSYGRLTCIEFENLYTKPSAIAFNHNRRHLDKFNCPDFRRLYCSVSVRKPQKCPKSSVQLISHIKIPDG